MDVLTHGSKDGQSSGLISPEDDSSTGVAIIAYATGSSLKGLSSSETGESEVQAIGCKGSEAKRVVVIVVAEGSTTMRGDKERALFIPAAEASSSPSHDRLRFPTTPFERAGGVSSRPIDRAEAGNKLLSSPINSMQSGLPSSPPPI